MNIKEAQDFLTYAAKTGNLVGMRLAIKDGANIHFGYDLALEEAFRYAHYDCCDYLLSLGASLLPKAKEFLSLAVQNKTLVSLVYLHSQGVDIHTHKDKAFLDYIFQQNLELIDYFITHGSSARMLDSYPLRIATKLGNLPLVVYFLQHGAQLKDCEYQCVRLAAELDNPDILSYLVAQFDKVWPWLMRHKHKIELSEAATQLIKSRQTALKEQKKIARVLSVSGSLSVNPTTKETHKI